VNFINTKNMQRRKFIKYSGISAIALSASGFTILNEDGKTIGDCPTTTDILGPYFRENAPFRNQFPFVKNSNQKQIKVIGQVFASDCKTPLPNVLIDIWHCDENGDYDMETEEYKCRGRFYTDENGAYNFTTSIPPAYGRVRPKHIHYLIHKSEGHQELVTQLYFKGDTRIKENNWVGYPWDAKRILDIYQNENGEEEIQLDLYLTAKNR